MDREKWGDTVGLMAEYVATGVRRKLLRPEELAEILTLYKKYRRLGIGIQECYEKVGEETGRQTDTIGLAIRRLLPTVDVAEHFLKASSLKLAMRLVRKANPEQILDILSRKNIGVLSPKTDEAGGVGGFFLSVQADSCGAMKVAGGFIDAHSQRQVSGQDHPQGQQGPLSLRGESGGGGQESEDGGDAYPEGVPAGRPGEGDEADAALVGPQDADEHVEAERLTRVFPPGRIQGHIPERGVLTIRQQATIDAAKARLKKARQRCLAENKAKGMERRAIEKAEVEV